MQSRMGGVVELASGVYFNLEMQKRRRVARTRQERMKRSKYYKDSAEDEARRTLNEVCPCI